MEDRRLGSHSANAEGEQVMVGDTAARIADGEVSAVLMRKGGTRIRHGRMEKKMRTTIVKTSIAAAIVALGFGAYPSQSPAGEPGGTADMLRRACTVAAGRFEEGWIYKDTGVQWGEFMSCVTENIRLTCQDDTCRATGLALNGQNVVLLKQKASVDLGITVRSERDAFDRVLRNTAMY